MGRLTVDEYHQQVADCDGLCVITEEMTKDDPNLMRCVRCPFCEETVDAILTATHIACPSCQAEVKRS